MLCAVQSVLASGKLLLVILQSRLLFASKRVLSSLKVLPRFSQSLLSLNGFVRQRGLLRAVELILGSGKVLSG